MKSGVVALLAVACVGLSDTSADAQFRRMRSGDRSAQYGWLSSLAGGKARARREGKPLMVVMRCVP